MFNNGNKNNPSRDFKGIVITTTIAFSLMILELGIHNFQFNQVDSDSLSIGLIVAATLISALGFRGSFYYQNAIREKYKEQSLEDRIFKEGIACFLFLALTTIIIGLLLIYGLSFKLKPTFNIIKDLGLYLLLFVIWTHVNVLYIQWIKETKCRPKRSIAFIIPISVALITLLVLLFALNLDFRHLATFTGQTQDALALHIYVRMLLIIFTIMFSFFWCIRWLMITYYQKS